MVGPLSSRRVRRDQHRARQLVQRRGNRNRVSGAGISTGDKLVELDYPNLYRERMKDRPGGAYKPYFHFVTNIKTRDAIIATMNEALLHHNRKGDPGVILRSVELLDEMIDFGSTGGRMEGQGNHDDSVVRG